MADTPMSPVGVHYILELHGCSVDKLDDAAFVSRAMREAVRRAKSTLIRDVTHRFQPQGVTALALLAESHLSIHTWPENRYAAADLFTCGERARPDRACEYLVQIFEAQDHSLKVLRRGEPPRTAREPERAENETQEDAPWRDPRLAPISG